MTAIINPNDIIEVVDFQKTNPVSIVCNTVENRIELLIPMFIVIDWAVLENKLTREFDDSRNQQIDNEQITLREYIANYFDFNASLSLAKFAVKYYGTLLVKTFI